MRSRLFHFLPVLALLPPLPGQSLSLPLVEDYLLRPDNTIDVTGNFDRAFRVGSSSTGGRNVVFVFRLPDFGPVADPFVTAQLQSTLFLKDETGTAALDFNGDVYAFGPAATYPTANGDPSPVDYYEGAFNSAPGVVRVIDDYYTPSSPVGVPILAAGSLADFLNDVYAIGAGAGEIVLFQLVPDRTTNSENISYDVLGQEDSSFNGATAIIVTLAGSILPPGTVADSDWTYTAPESPSWQFDRDGNGVADELESLLGLDPGLAEPVDLSPLQLEYDPAAGPALFHYNRRVPVGWVEPRIEVSTDLSEWTGEGIDQLYAQGPESGGVEPVTAAYSPTGDRLFGRIKLVDKRALPELSFLRVRDLWARIMVYYADNTTPERNRGTGPFNGDYELVTRTLWTLGAWFHTGDRPNTLSVDGNTVDLRALVVDALRNGTDDAAAGDWPQGGTGKAQPTVEAANVAFTTWSLAHGYARATTPAEHPWAQLSSADRSTIQTWLDLTDNQVPANGEVQGYYDNNWNLFLVLNYGARRELAALGYSEFNRYNETAIGEAMRLVQQFHRGDGWYSDDLPNAEFDGYGPWTLIPHQMLYFIMAAGQTNAGTAIPGTGRRTRSDVLADISAYLATQPWMFDAGGGHPEWGRSTTYKFSRLMSLVLAHVIDRQYGADWGLGFQVLPDTVPLGQLRRLIRLHLNHYLSLEMIDPNTGRIYPGQTRQSGPEIIESYSTNGSTYWSLCLFATLFLLEDDDPLWSAPELPLPAEDQRFVHWLRTPGFLLHHSAATGLLELINLRNDKIPLVNDYQRKYAKFTYSSRIGYCTRSGPTYDQSLELNGRTREVIDDGDLFLPEGHPDQAVGRTVCRIDGWRVSTLVFLKDGAQIRVHRVTNAGNASGTFSLREGGYAFGHAAAVTPEIQSGADWRYVEGPQGSAFTRVLAAYNTVGWLTGSTHHSRAERFGIGYGDTASAVDGTVFALYSRGSRGPQNPADLAGRVINVETTAFGARITFSDGSELAAPFL